MRIWQLPAIVDHVMYTRARASASLACLCITNCCHSDQKAWPQVPACSMPETMEGDPRSLRIKIISMGAAECGKVSFCILKEHTACAIESYYNFKHH